MVGNEFHSFTHLFIQQTLPKSPLRAKHEGHRKNKAPVVLGLSEQWGRQRANGEQYSVVGVAWRSVLSSWG